MCPTVSSFVTRIRYARACGCNVFPSAAKNSGFVGRLAVPPPSSGSTSIVVHLPSTFVPTIAILPQVPAPTVRTSTSPLASSSPPTRV